MKLANKTRPSGDMPSGPDGDWRAESDLRTLIEAAKIKSDKGRMRAAMDKRDEQRVHLSSIRSPRNG